MLNKLPMKFLFIALFSLLSSLASQQLAAQEITRVAVLDYSKVLGIFPTRSRELQRLENLRENTSEQMEKLKGEIDTLQTQLLQAQNENNSSKSRQIEAEISKKRSFGRSFLESRNEEIRNIQARMNNNTSSNFQQTLQEVIRLVAREQGFSIILDKNSRDIIWLDVSIDITEPVLRYLETRLQQN